MMEITIVKNNHRGDEVWRYHGMVLARGQTWIKLEAYFDRPDRVTPYHIFRQGDRFVEWFYSDRWYSIFEMHDVDDDHLTGWYCNISRPRSEEHTSELQSRENLVCRLLLEKLND